MRGRLLLLVVGLGGMGARSIVWVPVLRVKWSRGIKERRPRSPHLRSVHYDALTRRSPVPTALRTPTVMAPPPHDTQLPQPRRQPPRQSPHRPLRLLLLRRNWEGGVRARSKRRVEGSGGGNGEGESLNVGCACAHISRLVLLLWVF